MNMRPVNVGICAVEVYFPYYFVDQSKLEQYDGVSKGKYTIGLGQKRMGFCADNEDINSLCLTVVHSLLEKNQIEPADVGRLEVGTETIIDKSKSVKTVLMQLFQDSGNTDIEGIDTTNACYGGTSALFNAVNWVESSSWDGRLAIVVIADIAVYAAGSARCTGGGGAIAFVIGPNAPIVLDPGFKATHMEHVYDFYKPKMSSEYPVIDGPLSVKCYLSALDKCYQRYGQKFSKLTKTDKVFTLDDIDYVVFHTPYCKLVQKSVGRCVLNDFFNCKNNNISERNHIGLEKYRDVSLANSFDDPVLFKEMEKASVLCSKELYQSKAHSSILLAENIGNMYTPSLYGSLVSLLLTKEVEELLGRRVLMFSYGSGLASSMFSMTLCPSKSSMASFTNVLHSVKDIKSRLDARKEVEPSEFVKVLEMREKHHNAKSYVPVSLVDNLFPKTYYLDRVDENYRRFYKRKVNEVNIINGEI